MMRDVAAFALVAAVAACSRTTARGTASNEAVLVYGQQDNGGIRLHAAGESGQAQPVALTPRGQRAVYCGALPGRWVIWASTDTDFVLTSLHAVNADGTGAVDLGPIASSLYRWPKGAWATADGAVVVQALRLDGSSDELLIARGGTVVPLAPGAFLAASGDRVAYLAHRGSKTAAVGDVRSIRTDGTGAIALGGGDRHDRFHGAAGGAILLTTQAAGVRLVALDGTLLRERPGSTGLLFQKGMLVAGRGDGFELLDRDLSATPLSLASGAKVLALLDDGRVAAHLAGAGVVAAGARDSTVLDGFPSGSAFGARQSGDRLVFTVDGGGGSVLRSAGLDGSGARTIAESHDRAEVVLAAPLRDGRLLFSRTGGEEAGSQLSLAAVDGSGPRPLGDDASGTLRALDQDLGGLTAAGRVVFEAELPGGHGPRLFVAEPGGGVRAVTGDGDFATFAAILQ